MVQTETQSDPIYVLASQTNWAWPVAMSRLFEPRGVSLIVAATAGQFVDVLRQRRVHAAILDADDQCAGLSTLRVIRLSYPRIPCLMLASDSGKDLLDRALQLDAFSVIGKPVQLDLLREQLNRLFVKTYQMDVFA